VKQNDHSGKLYGTNEALLEDIVRRLTVNKGTVTSWTSQPIGPKGGNFVTGGVFRLEGWANAEGSLRQWSMVVKIVRSDPDRDDPTHYNYWQREVLAYQSDMLDQWRTEFRVPDCYAVEEKPDGSIWLWLEDMRMEPLVWQDTEYAFTSEELGRFQAAYLLGTPMPQYSWLNKSWIRSWVNECRRYQSWPLQDGFFIGDSRIKQIVERFERVLSSFDKWVVALEDLPRTLAHQDFSENNVCMDRDRKGTPRLVLIDWQFASVSGIGEDLGRFFGLSISRGSIPIERFREYRAIFIESYIEGMRKMGWNGDERLPEFGFLASCAIRSVWEIPKLMIKIVERNAKSNLDSALEDIVIKRMVHVAELQMEMAEEANRLMNALEMANIRNERKSH